MKRTQSMRAATAYHEAGHAFVAWSLGVAVHRITIVPSGLIAGSVQHEKIIRGKYPELDGSMRARMRMEKNILIALAGPIAQRLYKSRSCRSWHSTGDYRAASDMALLINSSGKQASAYLKWLQIRTEEILIARWPLVHALAQELLRKGEIKGKEMVPLFSSERNSLIALAQKQS